MKDRQHLQSTMQSIFSAERSIFTTGLYAPAICVALALNGMTSAATKCRVAGHAGNHPSTYRFRRSA
jgi:hypothetical protein